MIDSSSSPDAISSAKELTPYFSVNIPPLMNVMTALVLAFVLGLGLAALKTDTLKNAAHDFENIIVKTIKTAIIPLLPLYIFGIFLNMTYAGQVFGILTVFIKIIGIIFLIHIGILLLQFCIAGGLAKKSPLKLLWTMMPAYFTALGTQSSAATIPVTLEQTKKNGVSEDIAGFTVPLCATIHMSGSTLKIVACALALMIMKDMPYDFGMFAGFICMLAITMVRPQESQEAP
jgi:Na+/H+-dicarboxylate symporter